MTEPTGEERYAFGDSDAAASRLAVLSEVFEAPSRALLAEVAGPPVALAVDLGCGPGFTTRLLAEVLVPDQVAGIDRSAAFLARARTSGPPGTRWYRHDVTVVPFPTGPADVLYARYVLAHVPTPLDVLAGWVTQLRPGGHLVVEEDDEIRAEHPVLRHYDELSTSLVAARGGDLSVGRLLGRAAAPPGSVVVVNRVLDHAVTADRVARLYAMNLAVWRHDPFIVDAHPPAALDTLARDLTRLGGDDVASTVVFRHRQVVLGRH
jgi:SAM-dependent methyltransferase